MPCTLITCFSWVHTSRLCKFRGWAPRIKVHHSDPSVDRSLKIVWQIRSSSNTAWCSWIWRHSHLNVSAKKSQDRQCTYKHNIEACSCNRCCRVKAVSITYSERVSVVLVIQQAKCMRHIILSYVACLAVPYFSTFSHKRHNFGKKLLNIKCVFWFSLQLLSETFLILRIIDWDIINGHRPSCKAPVILVRF
jgi:hypothetical protein